MSYSVSRATDMPALGRHTSKAVQAGLIGIVIFGVVVTPVWAAALVWGALKLLQLLLV